MSVTIERAAAEEVLRLLLRQGLGSSILDRVFRHIASLTEADWDIVFDFLDPIAKEVTKRWLVPVVYHVVSMEMERWHTALKGPPPLLDRAGVARRLNVSERTVERLVADGLLTPLWVGGSRRFTSEGVDSFLKRYAIRGRQSSQGGSKQG